MIEWNDERQQIDIFKYVFVVFHGLLKEFMVLCYNKYIKNNVLNKHLIDFRCAQRFQIKFREN